MTPKEGLRPGRIQKNIKKWCGPPLLEPTTEKAKRKTEGELRSSWGAKGGPSCLRGTRGEYRDADTPHGKVRQRRKEHL